MARKKAKRKWRPSPYNPDFTDLGLRLPIAVADLLQDAVESEAKRLSLPVSRNGFCARAIVAAIEKEMAAK